MLKRVLVLLAGLALAGSIAVAQAAPAAAPAPALVWSGNLSFGAETQTINNATPNLKLWDPANGTGSRLNFNAKYDAGSYGLFVNLREDDSWANVNNGKILVRRAYGWLDVANGLVRFQAGRLGDVSWATGSHGAGGQSLFGMVDGVVGAQVQIKPITGLMFGAFVPFLQTTNTNPAINIAPAGTPKNYVPNNNVPGNATPFANLYDAFNNLTIGATYNAKGLGDIEAGYQMFAPSGALPLTPNSGYSTSNAFYYGALTPPYTANPAGIPHFFFGLAYTGTQNLYACLEAKIVTSGFANYNYSYFDEKVSYNMAPLNFTLWGEEQFWPSSAPNQLPISITNTQIMYPTAGTQLHFKPIVDYTLGIFNFGAFVNFETSSETGSTLMGYSGGPYVKLTAGKGTYMKLTGEFGSGDLLPPAADFPIYTFPGNFTPSNQTPQWTTNPGSGFLWQVNCNFYFSF
jgi:hypothetical protein